MEVPAQLVGQLPLGTDALGRLAQVVGGAVGVTSHNPQCEVHTMTLGPCANGMATPGDTTCANSHCVRNMVVHGSTY
jgi:hypothetical protein